MTNFNNHQLDIKQRKEDKPMNITLAYCWGSENAGDKAITPGTLELLHQTFPKTQITVISVYSDKHPDFHKSALYIRGKYPDIIFVPNPLNHFSTPSGYVPPVLKIVSLFLSLLFPRLLSRIFFIPAINALAESDLMISNGGHLFFWSKRMGAKREIFLYVYSLLIAKRLRVPYGLYAQSFGPFEFRYLDGAVEMFFRWLFSGSCFIYTRESTSRSKINNLIDKSESDLGTVLDAAFFLRGQEDQKAKAILNKYDLNPNSFIAMTLRLTKRGSTQPLKGETYNRYGRKLSRFIVQWVEKKKIPIAIVCQTPGDIKDSEFVYEQLPAKYKEFCCVITDKLSPEALKSLYKNAIFLLGMRFHSLIFALSVNTPVLGLYYYDIGPKILGMMRDLGFQNYVFNIDDASPEDIFKRVNEIDQKRNEVSKKIEQKLTVMKKQSLNAMKKIKDIYDTE